MQNTKTAEYVAAQTAYSDGLFNDLNDLLETQGGIIDDMEAIADQLDCELIEQQVEAIVNGEVKDEEFLDLFNIEGEDFSLGLHDEDFDDLFEV